MPEPKDLLHFLSQQETIDQLRELEQTDPAELMLNPPASIVPYQKVVAEQLISRKKIKHKAPDWYANRSLIMPPPVSVEQSSSASTASYKQQLMRGDHLIDLTGGMGIDCLAMSESFAKTTYVELDAWLCEVFQHNQSILGKDINVLHASAEDVIRAQEQKAHFFIDPARRSANQKQVFHFENCTPNILEMMTDFQAKAHQVLVKASPMIDLSLGIQQLSQVKEVHVVAVKNDVKEVVFLLDFEVEPTTDPKIICANLETEQPPFTLTKSEEQAAAATFGEVKQYVYDPNAAIIKAGAFQLVSARYALEKLAPNTHLYTSDRLLENFPGRVFEVMEKNVTKKNLKHLLPDGKANVITKNYPVKADQLQKKLGLKDGGNWFVFGYRTSQEKKLVVGRMVRAR